MIFKLNKNNKSILITDSKITLLDNDSEQESEFAIKRINWYNITSYKKAKRLYDELYNELINCCPSLITIINSYGIDRFLKIVNDSTGRVHKMYAKVAVVMNLGKRIAEYENAIDAYIKAYKDYNARQNEPKKKKNSFEMQPGNASSRNLSIKLVYDNVRQDIFDFISELTENIYNSEKGDYGINYMNKSFAGEDYHIPVLLLTGSPYSQLYDEYRKRFKDDVNAEILDKDTFYKVMTDGFNDFKVKLIGSFKRLVEEYFYKYINDGNKYDIGKFYSNVIHIIETMNINKGISGILKYLGNISYKSLGEGTESVISQSESEERKYSFSENNEYDKLQALNSIAKHEHLSPNQITSKMK